MDERVSAADANRRFSHILRSVREGNSFVVTSHGNPVARIVPTAPRSRQAEHAREALLGRLAHQAVLNVGAWSRDELYEDDR